MINYRRICYYLYYFLKVFAFNYAMTKILDKVQFILPELIFYIKKILIYFYQIIFRCLFLLWYLINIVSPLINNFIFDRFLDHVISIPSNQQLEDLFFKKGECKVRVRQGDLPRCLCYVTFKNCREEIR